MVHPQQEKPGIQASREAGNEPHGQTGKGPETSAASDPTAAASDSDAAVHQLLKTLFHELFQTERSAKEHPFREAKRLGDIPPAQAMLAVSEHATECLKELPGLARAYNLPDSGLGQTAGWMMSNIRHWVVDRLIDTEHSYRGTLLGMRHGVDLVQLISQVALVHNRKKLAQWCARWLSQRTPLVEAVAGELTWFAKAPRQALRKGGGASR